MTRGPVGIVGVSGPGKTTLVRTVVGLQRSTSGTIQLFGTALSTGLRGRPAHSDADCSSSPGTRSTR